MPCIFNCSYAEQQLVEEERTKRKNRKIDPNTVGGESLDVIVNDTTSDEGSMSMDDKSLLDYDSSNSWESEKKSR